MNRCHKIPGPPPSEGDAFDPATSRALQALGRVFHLQRQAMQRRVNHPEMRHGEMFTLRMLAPNDGMSQRDLAESLHLSRPRITSILQGLEKEGAVRREPDPADQRITRVYLTDEGRRREMVLRADFETYVNKTIGALSDADKTELTRILDELSERIAALLCSGTRDQEAQGE